VFVCLSPSDDITFRLCCAPQVKEQMRNWFIATGEAMADEMERQGKGGTSQFGHLCFNLGTMFKDFDAHDKARLPALQWPRPQATLQLPLSSCARAFGWFLCFKIRDLPQGQRVRTRVRFGGGVVILIRDRLWYRDVLRDRDRLWEG